MPSSDENKSTPAPTAGPSPMPTPAPTPDSARQGSANAVMAAFLRGFDVTTDDMTYFVSSDGSDVGVPLLPLILRGYLKHAPYSDDEVTLAGWYWADDRARACGEGVRFDNTRDATSLEIEAAKRFAAMCVIVRRAMRRRLENLYNPRHPVGQAHIGGLYDATIAEQGGAATSAVTTDPTTPSAEEGPPT